MLIPYVQKSTLKSVESIYMRRRRGQPQSDEFVLFQTLIIDIYQVHLSLSTCIYTEQRERVGIILKNISQ